MTDFPNNERQKKKASMSTRGVWDHASQEMFYSLKSLSLHSRVILKSLTDFRKTVETCMDPCLPYICTNNTWLN